MALVYIAIGSNIDPELNIPAALGFLKSNGRITAISTIYCTQPVGSPDSPPFYNGVVAFETCWEPRELKCEVLRKIEEALGRVRTQDKNAARTIDLDIAIYGDRVIDEPDITIPSPDLRIRAFVAVPLLELDPDLVIPGTAVKLRDVVKSLPQAQLVPLEELTNTLRREIEHEP